MTFYRCFGVLSRMLAAPWLDLHVVMLDTMISSIQSVRRKSRVWLSLSLFEKNSIANISLPELAVLGI
jgi:hypothetical protein